MMIPPPCHLQRMNHRCHPSLPLLGQSSLNQLQVLTLCAYKIDPNMRFVNNICFCKQIYSTGSNSSLILEVSQICNVNEEVVLRVVSNLWENNSQYDNIDTVVQAVQETMKHSASSASNVRSSSQPQKSPASNVKEIGVANSEQDDLDQVTAKNQKRKPSQETVKQNVKGTLHPNLYHIISQCVNKL